MLWIVSLILVSIYVLLLLVIPKHFSNTNHEPSFVSTVEKPKRSPRVTQYHHNVASATETSETSAASTSSTKPMRSLADIMKEIHNAKTEEEQIRLATELSLLPQEGYTPNLHMSIDGVCYSIVPTKANGDCFPLSLAYFLETKDEKQIRAEICEWATQIENRKLVKGIFGKFMDNDFLTILEPNFQSEKSMHLDMSLVACFCYNMKLNVIEPGETRFKSFLDMFTYGDDNNYLPDDIIEMYNNMKPKYTFTLLYSSTDTSIAVDKVKQTVGHWSPLVKCNDSQSTD